MYTLGQILKHRTYLTPELEGLVGPTQRFTYKEYNNRVNHLAHYLLSLQVKRGDRVVILCTTNFWNPMILFAAAKIGAIAVPLNWRLNSRELVPFIEDAKPKVLFYDEEFGDVLSHLKQASYLERSVRVGQGEEIDPVFEQFIVTGPDTEPEVEIHADDPVVLAYTSGTTDTPKGVLLSHSNFYSASAYISVSLGTSQGGKYLFCSPLFHSSGLNSLVSAVVQGKTVVCMPRFHPEKVWDIIERERITIVYGAPIILKMMLSTFKNRERDLSQLQMVFSGGTFLPQELIDEYFNIGIPLSNVYGATEFTGAISVWSPVMGMEKSGSVGKVVNGEFKIVDPETKKELAIGETGEIALKSPSVFLGYWENSEATHRVKQDGWLYTGDAGYVDSDGFLYIVDRYKEAIRFALETVYPSEVEKVIKRIEAVQDVALVGISDPNLGEIPRAYVELKEGASLSEQDVLSYCHERMARFKVQEVTFIDELPRNGAGKILKRFLRDLDS
ncbi:class I adenylate-forming enzyme family protein [Hazenella coriacea]|uniref:Acyl-CoA synthetase (AMP-forming)/AMP-acid ligase II n=1 Tax=Hazenella coriacea TaxID=1179467 RepID=A0A4R3L840_9BACL|nr:class I adenylate-forming enzyme family protein [Hazenella coriacea]TCS95963.1 acyl-CoA synthetase (AMP-forming)/AMP-acid ligase II [Hazenella coriacea]